MATKILMSDAQALRTVNYYVCNICWGSLTLERSKTETDEKGFLLSEVYCSNPDCSGTGFVTRKTAERRLNDSHFEYGDAQRNIGELLGIHREHQTAEQALKELGF